MGVGIHAGVDVCMYGMYVEAKGQPHIFVLRNLSFETGSLIGLEVYQVGQTSWPVSFQDPTSNPSRVSTSHLAITGLQTHAAMQISM